MSTPVTFVFYLLSFIAFVAAAAGVNTVRRPLNLVALGLALWVFILLYATGQAL